jgi:hypothetical protein
MNSDSRRSETSEKTANLRELVTRYALLGLAPSGGTAVLGAAESGTPDPFASVPYRLRPARTGRNVSAPVRFWNGAALCRFRYTPAHFKAAKVCSTAGRYRVGADPSRIRG